MSLFVISHSHKYGLSNYIVRANKPPKITKKLLKLLNIDFEPDREEWVDVEQAEIFDLQRNIWSDT